ncbi:hypothetical protein J4211_05735 [Candidatus Woesearchaeota archaeon]|nr:hypothetical protein [Candidatus Woesearchaeota archaeon]
MEEEHRGVALVILGIIGIVAVIGLVLMFSGAKKSTGAVPTLMGNAPSGFCDSPCTFAFAASPAEVAMQTERYMARGFVPDELAGQCLCPPMAGVPFSSTDEQEQIIGYRIPGVPAPTNVESPASARAWEVQEPPRYPYPASLNK